MNLKMKDLMSKVASEFLNNTDKENKELAKDLCKAHRKVFECIMSNIEQAVEENKLFIVLPTQKIDDITRSCVKNSEAWHWAIKNTREYTVKNMERFGYETEIKDIFGGDGYESQLVLKWERGKHHDYSKES